MRTESSFPEVVPRTPRNWCVCVDMVLVGHIAFLAIPQHEGWSFVLGRLREVVKGREGLPTMAGIQFRVGGIDCIHPQALLVFHSQTRSAQAM